MMKTSQRNFLLLIALILLVGRFVALRNSDQPKQSQHTPTTTESLHNESIQRAIERQLSTVQVEGRGDIVKVLPDDTQGDRHQRMLVSVAPGKTILIVHNIDIAPRIQGVREGDEIVFSGEFKWNEKGGLVHWTHHDPRKKHADGWIRYQDRTYQ